MRRRHALRLLAGALALPALRPHAPARAATSARAAALERIGIQLYTLRGEMQKDFEGTLARVARLGYAEVEFAGYFGRSPRAVRTALNNAGLTAPAAHFEAMAVERDWARTLEQSARIGHSYVVAAWIDAARRRTLDDWRRWADAFNTAGERARAAGLRFAYHNHNYEFAPIGGQIPYDVLLAHTDRTLVRFELDLYWIFSAGANPLAYFARHPGRFPLVHVKDSGGAPAHAMLDVGQGVIDFRAIFARRAEAGMEHWFVEHDEPADPWRSAETSLAWLEKLAS
jgi:sugar phosphate isomerase/epimerase